MGGFLRKQASMTTRRIVTAVCLAMMIAAPAFAETWTLDPNHTRANFSARHMMVTTVRGDFHNVTGTVEYDGKDITKALINVTIDTRTLDTKLDPRDAQLKGPDFLDVAKYPTMTFKSKRIEPAQGGMFRVIGDLTIRTVTREVALEVDGLSPPLTDRGMRVMGTTAMTRINRKDFGMTWNRAVEAGGVLVGDEVTITLDIEMRRPAL
jgi:polyisoprenoid-binding protein YceI